METIKKLEELGISPAPWRDPKSDTTEGFVWDEEGRAVCHMSGKPSASFSTLVRLASKMDPSLCNVRPMSWNDYENPKRVASNARLVSAAPDLYDACCDLLEIVGNVFEYVGVDVGTIMKIERAKAALAKAGGEEVSLK